MFDCVIFSFWPKGLYLAQKLSEKGCRVAYVEVLPRLSRPFGCLLDEYRKKEKDFLETLGFLHQQERGFCLLNPKGNWQFQDISNIQNTHPELKNTLNKSSPYSFDNCWVYFLALNLAGKVFEFNNSEFSERRLNLFSDYFLFSPSLKKIHRFQQNYPNISFYETFLKDISFSPKESEFFIKTHRLKSKKYFWFLGAEHLPIFKKRANYAPHWQWSCYYFKVDFGGYEDIIPSHFVSITHIDLPWVYENLLSVFHKNNRLKVWIRQTCRSTQRSYLLNIMEHLQSRFPGAVFYPIEKEVAKGFVVYGEEILKAPVWASKKSVYIENLNDFFQGDIVSDIHTEHDLFKQWLKMNL